MAVNDDFLGDAATARRRKLLDKEWNDRQSLDSFHRENNRRAADSRYSHANRPRKPAPRPDTTVHVPRSAPRVDVPADVYGRRARTVQQAADIGSSGKPSATRSAVGGAAGGAATGAAVGSLFGGVGAVPGAVVGGVIGGAGGAAKGHAAKRAMRKAKLAALGPGRQMLVAEFLVCMVILALSPLTDKHQSEGAPVLLKRGAAICATFFILGLIGASGRGAAKVAASLGALITLSLVVSDRDIFSALANKMGATSSEPSGLAAGNAVQDVANNDITTESDIAGEGAG